MVPGCLVIQDTLPSKISAATMKSTRPREFWSQDALQFNILYLHVIPAATMNQPVPGNFRSMTYPWFGIQPPQHPRSSVIISLPIHHLGLTSQALLLEEPITATTSQNHVCQHYFSSGACYNSSFCISLFISFTNCDQLENRRECLLWMSIGVKSPILIHWQGQFVSFALHFPPPFKSHQLSLQ